MYPTVLVLYDSHGPLMKQMAEAVGEGVTALHDSQLILKHITDVTRDDLISADALILGSPNWSGISGSMKVWLDDQGDLWEEGALSGKIGAAFSTGRGRHSGLEFTLLSLIHWMLACGMLIVGLPWNEMMRSSGSYYGATATGKATIEDIEQARTLGQRVTQISLRMQPG